MSDPGIFIAFGIGILSFLAPCTLPVLPGYFSYLAGVDQEKNKKKKQVKVFITSFSFVLGFLLILVILGTAASASGQFLLKNRGFWQRIGGLIIIIFGLQTMGILRLKLKSPVPHLMWNKVGRGKAFLAGASFGISWTPCIGPILGSILVLASQTQTLSQGVGLLIAYALGLSIPMLFSGFLLTKLKFLKNRYIPLISGGILIVMGLLLFLDHYKRLTFGIAKIYQILKIPIF